MSESAASPLHAAAAANSVAEVARLVDAGASPYATDADGRTAFNAAASTGPDAMAFMVSAALADLQRPEAERRWPAFGINTPSGIYGSTLLTYAAKVSDAATVRAMIAAGAALDIVNGSGWTLLHAAAVMSDAGRLEVVRLLVQAFDDAGLGALVSARSTKEYRTSYGGGEVVYSAGLTAAGLCAARLEQDPSAPAHMRAVREFLAAAERREAA